MSNKGLNKDGGISFERKRNFNSKEPEMFSRKPEDKIQEEETETQEEGLLNEQPRNLDKESLLRAERLAKAHNRAKQINYSGFAFNGGSIAMLFFGINNVLLDPETVSMVTTIEEMTGINLHYNKVIEFIEKFKAQIISIFGSIQVLLGYYQELRGRMKNADREDTFAFINEELEKAGL